AARLPNLSDIASVLNAGSEGSAAARLALRARSGDLEVATGDRLRAQEIVLAADGGGGAADGSGHVGGTPDASGAQGGRIAIYANQQVQLGAGAALDAHATAPQGAGGDVLVSARIGATTGALDAVVLNPGARIDVSGGNPGGGGSVTLRANRVGND